jgi:hypothetical protein
MNRLANPRMWTGLAAIFLLTLGGMQSPILNAGLITLPANQFSQMVLSRILNPDTALLFIAAGWLLVCVEFCRPGSYLPGGLGVLAISLGGYVCGLLIPANAMLPIHSVSILGIAFTIVLTTWLLRVAVLARRNKFSLGGQTDGDIIVPPPGYSCNSANSSTTKPTE